MNYEETASHVTTLSFTLALLVCEAAVLNVIRPMRLYLGICTYKRDALHL